MTATSIELVPYTEDELKFNNIEGLEEWREYDFGQGKTYRVDRPIRVHITRKPGGDSHRLIDAQGVRHYVPSGWIGFRFEGKWGMQPRTIAVSNPAEKPVAVNTDTVKFGYVDHDGQYIIDEHKKVSGQ